MRRPTRLRLAFAAALALAGATSCSSDQVAAPRPAEKSDLLGISIGWGSPSLISCGTATPQSVTTAIGPLGGVLAVGGTQVLIPANAVLSSTNFTLTVPASKYVEVEVTAEGTNHFVFAQPVTVTLDYGRCTSWSLLNLKLLTAWNIDPVTKALLEPMVSVDNKLTHTVTFTTLHFSGYAVAD